METAWEGPWMGCWGTWSSSQRFQEASINETMWRNSQVGFGPLVSWYQVLSRACRVSKINPIQGCRVWVRKPPSSQPLAVWVNSYKLFILIRFSPGIYQKGRKHFSSASQGPLCIPRETRPWTLWVSREALNSAPGTNENESLQLYHKSSQ